jgi:hypothetical protein
MHSVHYRLEQRQALWWQPNTAPDHHVVPIAIPAWIFSALKPGGIVGSEKTTVSGRWPTNNTRVM